MDNRIEPDQLEPHLPALYYSASSCFITSATPPRYSRWHQTQEETNFFRTFGRNWKKGGFHFLPFLPEETWKKVEEPPKCKLGTITKVAVKSFPCILIQYYRFGGIFTLNCNKILHFPLKISNCTSDFS